METNADWSPYEGWDLAGFARTTLSRGEVIVDEYAVVGREGRGGGCRERPPGSQASARSIAARPPRPRTPAGVSHARAPHVQRERGDDSRRRRLQNRAAPATEDISRQPALEPRPRADAARAPHLVHLQHRGALDRDERGHHHLHARLGPHAAGDELVAGDDHDPARQHDRARSRWC